MSGAGLSGAELEAATKAAGDRVRELKAAKAPKPEIDAAVAVLQVRRAWRYACPNACVHGDMHSRMRSCAYVERGCRA